MVSVIKDHKVMYFKHCCGFQVMTNAQEYCGFQVFIMDFKQWACKFQVLLQMLQVSLWARVTQFLDLKAAVILLIMIVVVGIIIVCVNWGKQQTILYKMSKARSRGKFEKWGKLLFWNWRTTPLLFEMANAYSLARDVMEASEMRLSNQS